MLRGFRSAGTTGDGISRFFRRNLHLLSVEGIAAAVNGNPGNRVLRRPCFENRETWGTRSRKRREKIKVVQPLHPSAAAEALGLNDAPDKFTNNTPLIAIAPPMRVIRRGTSPSQIQAMQMANTGVM